MAGRTEARAAACDAAGRGVPNPDEDRALVDVASAGDPGTATTLLLITIRLQVSNWLVANAAELGCFPQSA